MERTSHLRIKNTAIKSSMCSRHPKYNRHVTRSNLLYPSQQLLQQRGSHRKKMKSAHELHLHSVIQAVHGVKRNINFIGTSKANGTLITSKVSASSNVMQCHFGLYNISLFHCKFSKSAKHTFCATLQSKIMSPINKRVRRSTFLGQVFRV